MDQNTLILLLGGLVSLIIGGELLVRGASKLAAVLGIPSVIIGLTVVAFGTSTPELAVSLEAAFAGKADIAVSNVVGSNIFNVLFILGLSAIISPLIIHSQMIKREVPIMIGVSFLFFLLALDGVIGRFDGVLLSTGIVAYTTWLVLEAKRNREQNKELIREAEKEYNETKARKTPLLVSIALVGIGLGIVMYGADWLVRGAVSLAKSLGVSDTVIGLTIVAAGTSLPEVVASIMATIKGERDIAIGNVVGSNIYNVLAILGFAGIFSPAGMNINETILKIDLPIMILVAVVCYPFFKSGKSLSRLEGTFFLLAYIAYTTMMIVNAKS